VRDWPQSRLAPTALFNASVDYAKARRLDKAIEVRGQLLQKFPGDPLAPKVLYDNAEAFEAMAEFGKAADLYERYFAEWSKRRAPAARAKGAAAPADGPAPAYEEKKAEDAIINAAVFRAGLREWAKAEAASLAYLETWPKGPDAPRIFLSLADLYAKRGQTSKELKQLEEYQLRHAKDPEEWLAIQHRIALLYERAGNRTAARRTYEAGLDYYKRRKPNVKERGLAVVAQGMYDALEKDFAEYDRISLNVAPKYLKGQLEVKGKKLTKLEQSYGQVVKLKQAGPAICALYRIGLGYRRFAQTLLEAPIPRELRGSSELVQEYKAQLAQFAEPLDAKAFEGLGLAVNASRDYGVVNDCAKQATALLLKHRPDEYGPSPEVVPALGPAPAAPGEPPRGYGLLAEVVSAPPPPRERSAGARSAEPALPPLRVRPAAAVGGELPPRRVDGASLDPQRRSFDEERLPQRKGKKKSQADDDEDLLP